MSEDDDTPPSASETLARLVAERKSALQSRSGKGVPGQRESERRAGALSASKSKPAPRKG